jgi:hypothetical protein
MSTLMSHKQQRETTNKQPQNSLNGSRSGVADDAVKKAAACLEPRAQKEG